MPKIRVVQVAKKGSPFELVERELPEPGRGEVRIKVQACGICHRDAVAKEGLLPTMAYPIVPGHEIAGIIDAVGEDVVGWSIGARVGVGWFGGHCFHCEPCWRGEFMNCCNLRIPGVNYDGGYAEAMIAPAQALVLIPEELPAVEAAPLLCAGVTIYNTLRESGAHPGDLVAILGMGSLGQLGAQFAAKMRLCIAAVAPGYDNESLARKLGAHIYLNSQTQDVAAELTKFGGARAVLATVNNGEPISSIIPGLAVRGKLVAAGVGEDLFQIPPSDLIGGGRSAGHASGASINSGGKPAFNALSDVQPMIETIPLERAADAYDEMMRGEACFRRVLTM